MTPDDRVGEIEKREAAATPGPWEAHELEAAEYCVLRVSEGDDDYGDDVCSAGSMTDAQFIAAAREDVPWLIGQLRDARDEVERLRTTLGRAATGLESVLAGRPVRNADEILIAARSALTAPTEGSNGYIERLTGAVNALRGEPPELTWWSHHDVAERAAGLVAELATERAKVERVEALCDEYRANCAPDTKQAQVAEIFRAALTEGDDA